MDEDNFIDVDRTVLEPSPQRVRNILTLEERVRAIQAYDCRPMYTKVAKMFNCSWEQIKNIIINRAAIVGFYEATKNIERNGDPNLEEIRQRKIAFLGECMYEYIQRAQFHQKVDLTEELIRMKAFEFRDVMGIDNFMPNKAWINHFKATYNFSLSNRQIMLTRTPPSSLDLKDIMMYCTKNKAKVKIAPVTQPKVQNLYRTTTKIAISNANDATLEELTQRRQRKIDFLERALHEYMQRFQYYRKTPLSEKALIKIARVLKEMLKINNFMPNKIWLNGFKNRNSSFQCVCKGKRPLISLDLKDILSYCGRKGNNANHICNTTANTNTTKTDNPQRGTKRAAPSLTPSNITPTSTTRPTRTRASRAAAAIENNALHDAVVKQEIIDLDEGDDVMDIKPSISDLERTMEEKEDTSTQPPLLKISKTDSDIEDHTEQTVHSPGHWSEYSDREEEELPKHVKTYADALKLLKPLEEFAMLEENFRVIGLVSQLEEIFKNPPKNTMRNEED